MSSREDILQSIRRATHVKYEKPDLKPLEEHALTYPNVVEQFYFMMKQEDKHKDETDKLSATVEANTKVLTELCTLIKTLVK